MIFFLHFLGNISEEIVKEKCDELVEKLRQENGAKNEHQLAITEKNISKSIGYQREKSLSVKRLEHEINLKCLNYEKKKWSLKVDKQVLIQNKLQKKLAIKDIQYEIKRVELEILKEQASQKVLPDL